MSEFNQVLNKKAVALRYDEAREAAPVIVATGTGYMAERILETAAKNGVPVYEDNSLATLLTQLGLGAEIPQELYQTVVDIYLYFLKYTPGSGSKESPEEPDSQQEEDIQAGKE